MNTPADIWLGSAQVAELLGCTDRHVRNSMRLWNYRYNNGALEIQLKSLPQTAIDLYMLAEMPHIPEVKVNTEDTELVMRTYDRSTKRVKKHFDMWCQILARSEGIVGTAAINLWVSHWNKEFPEMKTSAGSIYRVRAQVAEHGRMSLLNECRTPGSTVKDEWWDWFKQCYLNDNKLPVSHAWRITLGKAMDAGHVSGPKDFPSASAFERRLRREVSDGLILYAREGKKAFYNTQGYHIERDFSSIPAGYIWVGDTRTWDVFVKENGQETPSTAYITLFIDMRTFLPMGWHLHTSAPGTDNTLRAIRKGIETYGVPNELYVDNGREYRNKDFSGQTRGHKIIDNEQYAESLAHRLDIKMHFAIVRNARAKIIERQFLNIKNGFDRLFSTFKGGSVAEKPESLKGRLKRGDVIAWDDFKTLATEYLEKVFSGIRSDGKHLGGQSPAEAWNTLIVQREPMRSVSVETASMLTTRIATGRIGPRGFHLAEMKCTWWAEWMPTHKGKSVVLRYDPEDLRIAWCYAEDGQLLGEAELVLAVNAMVSHGDAIGKEQVMEGVARKKREEKILKELFPEIKTTDAMESVKALVTAVATPEINRPNGATQLTKHDHDAKEITAEHKRGKADLSVLVPLPDPKPTKRFSFWDDDNHDEPLSNHG